MIKTIEIVFENCECLTVDAHINFDIISKRDDGGCSINNVEITIPKSSNGIYEYPWRDAETTIINRLNGSRDITQIIIDGVTHFPVWYEEDDEYSWSQHNEYQHTYRTQDGNLIIDISTKNKQRETEREKILNLLHDYWVKDKALSFGEVILRLNIKLPEHGILLSSDTLIVDALEGLIVEQM